jgi:hypothetical protein
MSGESLQLVDYSLFVLNLEHNIININQYGQLGGDKLCW